jgi:metal-responsive CopG/Arc/MetJ family transcriptional regulator
MRTHVVLPEELVEEVDELTGRRKRSQFIEEAIRDKVRREKLSIALRETAGMLNLEEYPHLASPGERSEWVHRMRGVERDPWLDAWYRNP